MYTQSLSLLERALKVIPTGSQTFSKSFYSLPKGGAPLFLESGSGCLVQDVDGNEYIDLINGLLCVSLGYQDEEVNDAILRQLDKGISFSLPHMLEIELSEILVELIPCAEMVRFGKNGTDVTSASIRLARAYTGKDHIAICGYHGWQDWYIGTTSRDLGVPSDVKQYSHTFSYNNINSLRKILDQGYQLAAVIMEPMNLEYPEAGFLESVRDFCDENDIVLIFDEIITGFRFDLSGAQSLFNVIPDLATFGKGMANGMPISALVGKREIMRKMDDIFFSGTFGGETLSLAAAKASIEKMKRVNSVDHMKKMGSYIAKSIDSIVKDLGIEWFSLTGHDTWKIMNINAGKNSLLYKTLIIQMLASQGILTIGSHNMSYAIKEDHAEKIIDSYRYVLSKIVKSIASGSEADLLLGELIQPVFRVRS